MPRPYGGCRYGQRYAARACLAPAGNVVVDRVMQGSGMPDPGEVKTPVSGSLTAVAGQSSNPGTGCILPL